VTALDDQPSTHTRPQQPAVDGWEWHEFDGAGEILAHLYLGSELRGERSHRLVLVRPWCETLQRFPLDHDRPSVTKHKVIPQPGRTCPVCVSRNRARWVDIPHPRTNGPEVRR
jgi:hypothetical protein